MTSTEDIIGRADANDIEAILAVTNTDVDSVLHAVKDNADCLYTWDYSKGARPQLEKLYEKAKLGQWNGETDLPWDTVVDPLQEATQLYSQAAGLDQMIDFTGTGLESWGEKEWIEFNLESQAWTMSQFMHGEQGALVCTAKIVETVP
ncbi:MAG: ferritin-like domain-containing protein, partial [Actinomycetota bacterium]|nr:ferritin-like domain-containing protein [Actinomycetota bacterium]